MPILACAAVSLLASRPLALVALAATAVAVGLGVAGWTQGLADMEAALQWTSPDPRAQAREVGERIARATLVLAAFAAPGLAAGIVGLARAGRARPG